MIGIGIIGCGKIAQVRHLPEYADNQNVRIAGVFDNNTERAQEIAARYGAKAYDSLEELLASPDIDAVSVCVANVAHCDVTIKALESGHHVLCEKPMAVTIDECRKMVASAKACGKKLMIGQNQRLAPAHIEAKRLIDAGEIGRVLTFHTAFGHSGPESWSVDPGKNTWFFDKKQAAMGVMADLGIHKTDLIQYLIGQRVTAVSAKLCTLDKTGPDGLPISVDDNAICIYEMSGGAVGTMAASWTYYGAEDNSTVIFGTEGSITVYDIDRAPIVLRKKGCEAQNISCGAIQTNDNQIKSGIIDAFVDCLVNDSEPSIPADNVLPAMEAVFAAIESSETGKRIVL